MTVYSLLMVLFVVVLGAVVWVSSDRFPHVRRKVRERTEFERKQAMARRERVRRERIEAAAPPEWDTGEYPPLGPAEKDPAA